MARHSLLLQLLTLLAFSAALALAKEKQKDFAACPVNHVAAFFCCSYGNGSRVLFTKFQLPPSSESYYAKYRDGWRHPERQINSPSAMYTPDTPKFRYDAAHQSQMCRLLLVPHRNASGFQETMQCGQQNTSMLEDSHDFDVFMSFNANPRNNNASFPIGAVCEQVDASQKAKCNAKGVYSASHKPQVKVYFKTYHELPILLVYTSYGKFFLSVVVWFWLNKRRANRLAQDAKKPANDSAFYDANSLQTSKEKHLLSGANCVEPLTPLDKEESSSMAFTPLGARNSSVCSPTFPHQPVGASAGKDQVRQFGYNNAFAGTFNFYTFVWLTLALNGLLIVIICDYYDDFYPTRLFNRKNGLITAFIVCWSSLALWFLVIVLCQSQLRNFFRVPAPLSSCEFVLMIKSDRSKVLLHDASGISAFVELLERKLLRWNPASSQRYEETLCVQKAGGDGESEECLRFVDFQHVRYIYDDISGRFVPGRISMPTTHSRILSDVSQGISSTESTKHLELVGANAIDVRMPTWTESLVTECFTFFYIYQMMCYYVWYYFNYWRMAIVMSSVIAVTGLTKIYTKRRMHHSVVDMARYESECQVFRDNQWMTINTRLLVPGDLVRVEQNWILPCDLVLVKGSVVCDEAMLTGESMPVQKRALSTGDRTVYDHDGDSKKHTLFGGTLVLGDDSNSSPNGLHQEKECLAVVMKTGAHTCKGRLVHSILYPAPMRFKYDQHLKVLIAGLFVLGAIAIAVSLYILISDGRLTNKRYSFIYALAMLVGIVSPLLPVVITVGQVQAARRLERIGIFCLNARRITLSGKTRVFCFDKTGTLTKKGLDLWGVQPVVHSTSESSAQLAQSTMNLMDMNNTMRLALASCHSLGSLDSQLVGNEVEIKMFQATQWELLNDDATIRCPASDKQYDFVKRFAFDHARRMMSVVVKERSSGRLHVFCKGSHEELLKIAVGSSVPEQFAKTANTLAKQGFYVLGIAHKELDATMSASELDALMRDRTAIEQNMNLLGLLLFRNDLKEDTSDAIQRLKEADTRVVMITGDSALCGCFMAKECGMMLQDSRVLLGHLEQASANGLRHLVWTDIDTNQRFSLDQVKTFCQRQEDVELAVTGEAFHHLKSISELKNLLFSVRVFSRMSPDDKVMCIEEFMAQGVVTGMCGDGGNDCGALRVAHVGLALSDSEASVVAPFTSKNKSISSVIDLCREGRCSLATSFASVKFLVMHGLTMTTMRLVQYINVVIISEWCYNYCNGFVLVGLSYVLTLSKPLNHLGPQRPTSSLIGPTTLLSLLGQEAINVGFLLLCIWFLKSRDWYCPFSPDSIDMSKWWLMGDNPVATCLFFVTAFQQQTAALVFTFGSQFRQPVFKNYGFVAFYGLLVFANLYLLLGGPDKFTDLFRIASGPNVVGLPDIPLPFDFRVECLLLLLANLICVALFELVVILGPIRAMCRRKYHRNLFDFRL